MAVNPIEGDHHGVLAWSLFTVILISLLPARIPGPVGHRTLITLILTVCVLAQCAAWLWGGEEVYMTGQYQGLYSNPHYLAMYAVLAAFFLAYLIGCQRGWQVLALGGLLLLDLWLLALTRSVPALLGMLMGILALLPCGSSRLRATIMVVVGLATVVALGTYAVGGFELSRMVTGLVSFIEREERWVLWREFWILQGRSTELQWWFGHGFGQFLNDYMSVSSFHAKLVEPYVDFASPHNYLLELLYSHGIMGLLLFVLAYGLWFWGLCQAIVASHRVDRRRLGLLLLSLAVAQSVLGFLTMPFFSRRNLYLVSLLLGISLRYMATSDRHD